MSKWVIDIHGELEGDYDLIKKYEEQTIEAIPKADYEARLKAEREKIAKDVADKMHYMGSCLNEENIILGIITGERKSLESLCSTCNQSCPQKLEHNLKVDYEARLKADMVAMLEDLDLEIDESAAYNREVAKVQRLIRDRIDELKEQTDVKA